MKSDPNYFEILSRNIEPNLFLFRWILCMLNREISFKNILWIWDCVFFYEFMEFSFKGNEESLSEKEESRLNFLDFVCLAMIFDLKNVIINSEVSVILSKFLKYPNEKNINHIMKEAFKYSKTFNIFNFYFIFV